MHAERRVPAASARVLPAVVVEPKRNTPSEDGGAAQRTVVFLHGWPDSPALWSSQIKALTQIGFRCVAIPLPGYPPDDAPSPSTPAASAASSTAAGVASAASAVAAPSSGAPSFDSAVDDIATTIRANNNNDRGGGGGGGGAPPVVLVCHDWGCVVGYKLQRRYPELVGQMAALDVGNDISGLTTKEKALIATYQAWLLAAHLIGGRLGDGMTTWFARFCHAPSLEPGGVDHAPDGRGFIPSARNWPYLRFWQEQWGSWRSGRGDREGDKAVDGLTSETRVEEGGGWESSATPQRTGDKRSDGSSGGDASTSGAAPGPPGQRQFPAGIPSCPLLYLYGGDKPVRFHGDRWLEEVRAHGP